MKKTILFFTLIALVVFSSCDKDGYNKEDFEKEKWEDKGEWEKDECFYLVYPVTYTLPDGSVITVNDDNDFAVENWYKNNESEEKPQLHYPVQIIFEGENEEITKTIANEDEMVLAKKKCDDGEWKKDECFYLVYPITFIMPDESSITLNDDEDSAVKDWYEANPDVEEKPELQYPVDIIYEKDETVTITIANEDEMIDAKKDCYDDWYKEKCFDLVYPITFAMPDGSAITVNNDEDSAVKDWYEANPDVEEKSELQYPVDIVFEDGTTQTVNNEDQMDTAKETCDD